MIANGNESKIQGNPLNSNWEKFNELWQRINKRYAYTVEFDSDELVNKSITALINDLHVTPLRYILTKGEQKGVEFSQVGSTTRTLKRADTGVAKYDLIGKICEGTSLTRATVTRILKGIGNKLRLFSDNPEEFISRVSNTINQQKASIIIEHVSYAPSAEEPYSQDIFTMSYSVKEFHKAFSAKNAIQNFVFTDGMADDSVEKRFVSDLDTAEEVIVYAKLPKGRKGFYIPTPVGDYSPDWAISFKKGSVKHIFFIAETKGSMDSTELRPIEKAKIDCAKKLFNEISDSGVKYHDVDSYQSLLEIMETL
jgi:type III restriction enzyme